MQVQLQAGLEMLFKSLGAVRSEVTTAGVATHWITEKEADLAAWKLREMGLLHVEMKRDGGCFAVFGKFDLPQRVGPVFNPDHPQYVKR